MKVSIEERLGLVSFEVDKDGHIRVDASICARCEDKPCLRFCPARRFVIEGDAVLHTCEGCLECGTCKFACPKGAVEFGYPRGGYGVYYKYG